MTAPQPVRVTIRRPGAPERVAELAADPEWRLLDLLLNVPPAQRGGAEVVRWEFRQGDRPLAATDRVRDVAARSRGGPFWADGVLLLELVLVTDDKPDTSETEFELPSAGAPGGLDADSESAADVAPTAPAAPPAPPAAPAGARPAPLDAPVMFPDALPPAAAPRRKARAPADRPDAASAAPRIERRATVRYYARMNPDRMFPLLVVLSAAEISEVVKKNVKQAQSDAFQVDAGAAVEVEPVLPGCDCYPPRQPLTVEPDGDSAASFWVVPKVLGRVEGARVVVRQGAKVLAEVPLEIKVAKQTLAVACGLLSLAAPYLTMGLKSLKLDYESQKAAGFPVYQRAGAWVVDHLRPEWIGLGFLGLAVLLYLWLRPRRRDVFWDIRPKS